jgi:hypothetical protein
MTWEAEIEPRRTQIAKHSAFALVLAIILKNRERLIEKLDGPLGLAPPAAGR